VGFSEVKDLLTLFCSHLKIKHKIAYHLLTLVKGLEYQKILRDELKTTKTNSMKEETALRKKVFNHFLELCDLVDASSHLTDSKKRTITSQTVRTAVAFPVETDETAK
jgi:hypothetical protein